MAKEVFIEETGYCVSHIYKNPSYEIDRLDISRPGSTRPSFVRGIRITILDSNLTAILDGLEADSLIYSLAIIRQSTKAETLTSRLNDFLTSAILSGNFLEPTQECEIASKALSSTKTSILH